jgi:hypothetical protein
MSTFLKAMQLLKLYLCFSIGVYNVMCAVVYVGVLQIACLMSIT